MNALSGYIEIDLAGQVLPFKFGSNAWALYCEMHKIEFYQINESGIFGHEASEGVEALPPSLDRLKDLYYCAYKAAMRSRGDMNVVNSFAFNDLLDEAQGVFLKLQEVMLTAKIMGYTFTELAAEGKKKVNQ
jgi:hypothetical protein